MGIRYYAYPVAPKHTAAAAADPRAFVAADPFVDAWGLVPAGDNTWVTTDRPRPRMLYLDKCWHLLQELTSAGGAPRPAHALVAGNVIHTPDGWIPHLDALSPAEVRVVSADLDAIADDLDTVRTEDREYVRQYLTAARMFTRELAGRGEGLAYLIG